MLWMTLCIGNVRAYDRKMYADAILRATPDVQERRLLVVTAWAGNWFHLHSAQHRTPYFDVTEYHAAHPEVDITLERGAGLALRFLRLHHEVRCRGAGWATALGRYHTGVCGIDRLAVRQMGLMRRMVP